MSKLLIIHPKDQSTDFLNPIWQYLIKVLQDNAIVCNIDYNDEAHDIVKAQISSYNGENILFLGHGNSTCLMGARCEGYYNESFITKDDIRLFNEKNVLSFSCRSIDFFKPYQSFSYVSFDDIPSEMNEVTGARDYDCLAYPGVDEEIIEEFKKKLVLIIGNSVYEWSINKYNVENLYHRIRLRVNHSIVNISQNVRDEKIKRPLINLLIKLKNEMGYYKYDI